jgi:ankyrin repeat protein
LLQQSGIDIDYIGSQRGRAPLHEAVANAPAAIVKLLLDKKPDVNIYSYHTKQQGNIAYGRYGTPLHNLLFKPKETFKTCLIAREGWHIEQGYGGLEDYLKEREKVLSLLLNFPVIGINISDSAGNTPLAYVQRRVNDLASASWRRKEYMQELQFLNLARAILVGMRAK